MVVVLLLPFAALAQAQTQLLQPVESAALALPEAPGRRTALRLHPRLPRRRKRPRLLPDPGYTGSCPDPCLHASCSYRDGLRDEAGRAQQSGAQLKLEEQQHLLGVVPNFNVVLNGQALPINGRQKWDLALHEAVNPFYFGWAFVIGGGYSEWSTATAATAGGLPATSSASAPTTPTTSPAS